MDNNRFNRSGSNQLPKRHAHLSSSVLGKHPAPSQKHTPVWVELPYLFLHVDDDELHGEADDVAGVQAVPDGQEKEGGHLREDLIAQELQPLEHMPSKTQAQRGTPPSKRRR